MNVKRSSSLGFAFGLVSIIVLIIIFTKDFPSAEGAPGYLLPMFFGAVFWLPLAIVAAVFGVMSLVKLFKEKNGSRMDIAKTVVALIAGLPLFLTSVFSIFSRITGFFTNLF